jgi:hypothetical protein
VTATPLATRTRTGVLAAVVYIGIRLISLGTVALLLPRGGFADRRWSFTQWITTGDFGHYRDIAQHWYAFNHADVAHASVFAWYPGYPAAIDALRWIPGLTTARAAATVTLLAGVIAAAGVAILIERFTGDSRLALFATAIWAAAPGSLVLSMLYSEALFCALAAWALVALAERRWLTAGLLTALAGTVHSTAVALIAAIATAAAFAVYNSRKTGAIPWRPIAATAISPLGLLGYWAFVAVQTHKLTGWFWIERTTCHISFDEGRSLVALVAHEVMTGPDASHLLVLAVLGVAIALAVITAMPGSRTPAPLVAYTITILVLATGSSANWISSKPRFLLPAFLLALPLARLLARTRTAIALPILTVLAAASTWLGLYWLVIARWAP